MGRFVRSILGWILVQRRARRYYFLSIAFWYSYFYIAALITPPHLLNLTAVGNLLPGRFDDVIVGLLFLVAAGCDVLAFLRYTPRTRIIASTASLAVACGWTMLLVVGAIAGGEDWGPLGIWSWVVFVMAMAVRIPDISPQAESEMYRGVTELLQETQEENSR